jgi:hypothetical protein
MTFGSTSSPCSAQYVKNKNADNLHRVSAAKAIKTSLCRWLCWQLPHRKKVRWTHGWRDRLWEDLDPQLNQQFQECPPKYSGQSTSWPKKRRLFVGDDDLRKLNVFSDWLESKQRLFGFALNFHRVPCSCHRWQQRSSNKAKRILT